MRRTQSNVKLAAEKACEWLAENKNAQKFRTTAERRDLARMLFEHLREGKSFWSFRGCHKTTLQRYMEEFPEDFEGLHEALADRQALYEIIGKDLMTGEKKGNGAVYCRFMTNEFPENWQDKALDVNVSTLDIFEHIKSREIVNDIDDEA